MNDHLFAQLERLSDEDMSAEKLATEIARSSAVVAVADQILRHATLNVKHAKPGDKLSDGDGLWLVNAPKVVPSQ